MEKEVEHFLPAFAEITGNYIVYRARRKPKQAGGKNEKLRAVQP